MKKNVIILFVLAFLATNLTSCFFRRENTNNNKNNSIDYGESYLQLNYYSIEDDDRTRRDRFIVVGKNNLDIEEIVVPLDGHDDPFNSWLGLNINKEDFENGWKKPYFDSSIDGDAISCECVTGFNNCPNLKRVIFKSYVEYRHDNEHNEFGDYGIPLGTVVSIDNAFINCQNLSEIIFENVVVENIESSSDGSVIDSSKYVFSLGKCFQNCNFTNLELPYFVAVSQGRNFETRNIAINGVRQFDIDSAGNEDKSDKFEQDNEYSCLAFNNSNVKNINISRSSQTRIVNTNLQTIESYCELEHSEREDEDLYSFSNTMIPENRNYLHFDGEMPNLKEFVIKYFYRESSINSLSPTKIIGLLNGSTKFEHFSIENLLVHDEYYVYRPLIFENCFNNTPFKSEFIISGESSNQIYDYTSYLNCFNNVACDDRLVIDNEYVKLIHCFNNISAKNIILGQKIYVEDSFENLSQVESYTGQVVGNTLINSNNIDCVEVFPIYKHIYYSDDFTELTGGMNAKKLIFNKICYRINTDNTNNVILDKVEELVVKDCEEYHASFFVSNDSINIFPNLKKITVFNNPSFGITMSNNLSVEEVEIHAREDEICTLSINASNSTGIKSLKLFGDFILNSYFDSSSIEEVNIEGSIKSIERSYAFRQCENLKSIEFAKDVVEIARGAFLGCTSLMAVTLEKINSIDSDVFNGCTELVDIYLPNVSEIKRSNIKLFQDCSKLEHVYFGKIEYINAPFASLASADFIEYENGYYFGDSDGNPLVLMGIIDKNVNHFSIARTTRIIANEVFLNCAILVEVHSVGENPNVLNLNQIGEKAFYNCDSLGPDIYIGNSSGKQIQVESYAFYSCDSIKSITDCGNINTDEGTISYIGRYALPSNMISIYLCSSTLVLQYQTTYPQYIFINSMASNISINSSSSIIYTQSSSSSNVDTWNCNVSSIKVVDKYLKSASNYSSLYKYSYFGDVLLQVIPPSSAIYKVTEFKVSVPDNIITTIAPYAFRSLSDVYEVDISGTRITKIDSYTFTGCDMLQSVVIGTVSLDGINKIYKDAFKGCSLLSSITFKGTCEQWNNIEKQKGWDNETCISVIHCYDEDINM